MRTELRDDDLPQALARAAIEKCNADQLDQIEAAVSAGDRTKLVALAKAYEPPFRSWDDQAWQAAMASQALSHADTAKMIAWSTAYTGMPILNQWTTQEQADLPRLRAKTGGTGRLTTAQMDRLFEVLGNLRFENQRMSGGSQALLGYAEAVGIKPEAGKQREILAEARRIYGACVVDPYQVPARPHRAYDALAPAKPAG
jgi:hypothetical protein